MIQLALIPFAATYSVFNVKKTLRKGPIGSKNKNSSELSKNDIEHKLSVQCQKTYEEGSQNKNSSEL